MIHGHCSGSKALLDQVLERMLMLTEQIQQTPDLNLVLAATVQAVREILSCDRVVIYQLLPNGDGVVIQEAVGAGWLPIQGHLIYDPCFQATWVKQYQQGQVSRLDDATTKPLPDCYRDLLTRLQVRAKLAVPIRVFSSTASNANPQLWGLLIAHQCRESRHWQDWEVNCLRQIALQLSWAIAQNAFLQPLPALPEQHFGRLDSFEQGTRQQRTEKLLRLVDASFEYLSIAATWVNRDAEVLRVNQAACQMLGRSREELQSSRVYDNDPNFSEANWAAHWQELQQKKHITLVSQHRTKDGRIIPVEISANYIEFEGEEYNFLFARDISEQRQAAEALQASQERFAGILEIANDAIISVDTQQRITLFNQGAEKVFGYTATEVLGQPLSLLLPQQLATVHPESVAELDLTSNRSQPMGERGEVWGHRKDGSQFPAEVSISKLVIAGKITFTVILRDITEQKRIEADLRQRSHHLGEVIALQQDIAAHNSNLDQVMELIVQRTQQLTHAQGAVVGFVVGDQLEYRAGSGIAADAIGLRLNTATSLSGRCIATGEILRSNDTETDPRVNRPICRQFSVRSMLVVPLLDQGHPIGVLEVLSDMPNVFTEQDIQTLQFMAGFLGTNLRLAAEFESNTALLEALRDSEERYRSVVTVLAEGIVLQLADGQITACNSSAERVLGLTADQMAGRSPIDPGWRSVHEDGSPFPRDQHPTQMTLRTGKPQTNVVMGVHKPDGSLTWISINSQPLFHLDQPKPYAAVTSFIDITGHKQAKAVLQQQAERERMIYTIAQHVRQSLDLDYILNTTVTDVRHFLQCDRVIIYRFNPDWSGIIVTESVAPGWRSILRREITDTYFVEKHEQVYQEREYQATSDIYKTGFNPCHIQLLEELQVRAKLVVPIWQGSALWGLLVAHHCALPHEWQPLESELLVQLATQVAIAIQQSELHHQLQNFNADLERQVKVRTAELQLAYDFEATLKRITDKVRDSLDEAQIMQTAVQELAVALGVDCCNATLYKPNQNPDQNPDQNPTSTELEQYEHTVNDCSSCWCAMQISSRTLIDAHLLQKHPIQFCTVHPDWANQKVTILVHPIFDDQEMLGELWLIGDSEHQFQERDVRLIQQVATQCAIALRQSRLYRTAQVQVEELARLNQLKDDFLNTISHELRTPMSSIKMALQMLEICLRPLGVFDQECSLTHRYFQILQTECQREISLINDLLDLTRLDAGTEPLNLSHIHLQFWIPHVTEPFIERTYNQEQQLKVIIPNDLPPLTTDLFYLERILTELLHNACKYTPMGGTITVSAQLVSAQLEDTAAHRTARVLIEVSNSGIEIPEAERDRIFDKFYRIPNHDPWKHGGTGLGLALVKKLVEQMGGEIVLKSAEQLTRFIVRLPLLHELTDA